MWKSLALRCLQRGVLLYFGSIASLQAAIMLLLEGKEEPMGLDAILVTAISGARTLGLHQLGDANLQASGLPTSSFGESSPILTEAPYVRTEIGVRIW